MPSPQTLAQFEIVEELGEGELGSVCKAHDSEANREVEIEILPAGRSIDMERLRQEVQAARGLDHWSIAKIFDLARAGDTDFLVREHVPGSKLTGPLPYPAALECARQMAGALAAGHSIGVTHRHLSPGNIVVSGENAIKLVDFGLTPPRPDARYLAPEQIDGRGADARSDIYAFGQVLREIAGPAAPKPLEKIIARCTQKRVDRRYQLMEDVQQALDHLASASAADPSEPGRRLLLIVGACVAAIVAGGWWMLGGRAAIHSGPTALTSDSGLTTEATISPDGRLVAYASDRSSPGVLHIWTQPASGGSATRLTDGAEDDHEPAIAPDKSNIVFRSERYGGGLYVVPAAGGAPQLLAQGGRDPRYSPDGRWIAYWAGDPHTPNGAVWVIASSGGAPRQVRSEFADARYPVWSPDGKHLLFAAHPKGSQFQWRENDWYVAPITNGVSEGRAIRTGAETLLRHQVFRESGENSLAGAFAIPEAWTGVHVLFSGRMTPMGPRNAGPSHIVRIPIDPTIFQATGAAHEVTAGTTEAEVHPSAAIGGRLVYSRGSMKPQIWSVALDGSGEPRRLVENHAVLGSVSLDGKRLAYRFRAPEDYDEIRVIDLDNGKQIAQIQNRGSDSQPLLSSSGDKVVYAAGSLFQMSLPSGKPEQIRRRRGGGNRVESWSADGKLLLVQRGWRAYGILNNETGEEREILRSDRFPITQARLSADGKWVAFAVTSPTGAQIRVAPAIDVANPTWIDLTAEGGTSSAPAWSADGAQIYFVQECQGARCIWARRFDARRRQASGDAFPVRHFHHARWSLTPALVAARDKLVFGMFENTGNIWSLPSLPRP